MLTDKVKQLDGKWIKIRGYILPSFQDKDIKQFVLVRDNHGMLLRARARPCTTHPRRDARRRPDRLTPPARSTVSGKFAVKELVFDGKQVAIYRIDGNSVK